MSAPGRAAHGHLGWLGTAALLAGCAAPSPMPPAPRCAAGPVVLLEAAPLFSGPEAGAMLQAALPKGRQVLLCGTSGQRTRVQLPAPGKDCSRGDCAGGWIARNVRTGPVP